MTKSYSHRSALVWALLVLFVTDGCSPKPPPGLTVPKVHAVQTIEPNITMQEVDLPGGDGTRTLWIYFPSNTATLKVPCVFIAPAGSTGFFGMKLAEGDRKEHLPYVRAGMMVVAYSLDGNLEENDTSDRHTLDALRAFEAAHAGTDNTRAAMDYAIAHVIQVNPKQLFVAGHSSAGIVALLAAENDPRIAGCVTYAPACDLPARLGEQKIRAISQDAPEFDQFIHTYTPSAGIDKLKCPLFLFHAADDENVPYWDVEDFIKKVEVANSHVIYSDVPFGGHYNSMIKDGIPKGIDWIRSQPMGF